MRIVVLGSTGLLGSAVGSLLVRWHGEDNVHLSYRNDRVAYGKRRFFYDPLTHVFDRLQDIHCDYIINCIGVIKPFVPGNEINTIMLNSVFPRRLADYCEARGMRLIHITTDCVFSGRDGNYDEDAQHDCDDVYGRSKSLGEPRNCMVLRTSIIGEELHNNASLVEWAKSQAGREVNGFTNHLWNGVTTKEYARICKQIIERGLHEDGIFHVHSDTVSKFQLLHLIDRRFKLGLTIKEFQAEEAIDRTLATRKGLNEALPIPCIADQVEAM